jgi:hypothetical protein
MKMKRNIFLTMLVMILALGMTVIGCDNGGDDNNNNGNGGTVTPTKITAYYDLGILFSFGVSRADSTLPGIDTSGKISDSSCGFSITVVGSNVPVKRVDTGTSGIYVLPQTNYTAGQSVTLSYTPNGTHIFKNSEGKTLGAFTLTATAQ